MLIKYAKIIYIFQNYLQVRVDSPCLNLIHYIKGSILKYRQHVLLDGMNGTGFEIMGWIDQFAKFQKVWNFVKFMEATLMSKEGHSTYFENLFFFQYFLFRIQKMLNCNNLEYHTIEYSYMKISWKPFLGSQTRVS